MQNSKYNGYLKVEIPFCFPFAFQPLRFIMYWSSTHWQTITVIACAYKINLPFNKLYKISFNRISICRAIVIKAWCTRYYLA